MAIGYDWVLGVCLEKLNLKLAVGSSFKLD